MVKLECQRCGNIWDYNGDSNYYAPCSNCKTSVSIEKRQVEDDD